MSFVGNVNSDIEDGRIKKGAPKAQLYDLKTDLNQTLNLYDQHPDIVKQMESLLRTYRPLDTAQKNNAK